jgi:hypothetical protein
MQNNDSEQPIDSPAPANEPSEASPNPTPEEPQIVPPSSPRSKKPLIISIVILGVLLLAGLVAAGYFLLLKPQDSNNQVNSGDSSSQTPQTIINDVRTTLKGNAVLDLDAEEVSLVYRIPGNKFLTYSPNDAVIPGIRSEVTDQAAVDAELKLAEGVLESKGFALDSLSSEEVDRVGNVKFWASDKIVCRATTAPLSEGGVYNQATKEYDYSAYSFVIECALISDFAATAEAARPFYEAYAKAPEHYEDNMAFGKQTVNESQTAGYKTAIIPLFAYGDYVGGFVGLFYQTPDEVWHYFKGTQQALDCSEYNTVDLKKAYLGDVCYDSSTESTVSL